MGFEVPLQVVDNDLTEDEIHMTGGGNYGVEVMAESQKRKQLSIQYVNFKMIPVTSNIVEQFFSQVKLNMTLLRNSLLPSGLQAIMFLKMNALLMTVTTVHKAMNVKN